MQGLVRLIAERAKRHALIIVLVGLAFACGALAFAWRADHRRVECYRDMADKGLVAGADCRR